MFQMFEVFEVFEMLGMFKEWVNFEIISCSGII